MSDVEKLVPDHLWQLLQPWLPPPVLRPQGGGRARADERAVFAAIVFVLTTGCPWRSLPSSLGVAWQTAYRRFRHWTAVGVWPKLHRVVLDQLGRQGLVDWTRAVVDSASVRAEKGASAPALTPPIAAS